ncbi:Uncharacterised protein [uncultured Clostridium sp.]|nr:Uncharacterised protein [uncultured Clostridium sp.]
MNVLTELQSIFSTDAMKISERSTILEVSFTLSPESFPNDSVLRDFLLSIPVRDTMNMTFVLDSGDSLTLKSNSIFPQQQYKELFSDVSSDSQIDVQIEVKKTVKDGFFSIYSFDYFASDLLSLDIKNVLSIFSALLKDKNYLIFEVFDGNCFFTTETMAFVPESKSSFNGKFPRLSRLDSCNDISNFYNKSLYELLPDDFAINIGCNENPLATIFEKICATLSLAYLSTSAVFTDKDELKVEIIGQRKIEYTYTISEAPINKEFYKIYNWIYTDGNPADKSLIARNIISLHCRYSSLGDIDDKTFSSIQSNYKIYLKENVSQYIDLKNKLAEFICDIVSRTGDYTTMLLSDLKKNLIAIFGFLFTVILANIVSDQPLENIFTKDITIILEIVIAGSIIYLIICNIETRYKLKKAEESYSLLKENYNSILSDVDLQEIFNNDKLLINTVRSVRRGIWAFTIIWLLLLLCMLIILEKVSCCPIIAPYITSFMSK